MAGERRRSGRRAGSRRGRRSKLRLVRPALTRRQARLGIWPVEFQLPALMLRHGRPPAQLAMLAVASWPPLVSRN